MQAGQVALYARVSSDQQAEAQTIGSQLAELSARLRADGYDPAQVESFVDDGWSGATLVRPALEQLRDRVAAGAVDVLYVHCPDRLARKYAYQALLLEEFAQAGVAVRFLNREVGATPEDQLLLQVQGMIAEYERAKFQERSRRGKRYAAQMGRVAVLGTAPYGYRLVSGTEAGGAARFEIQLEEARVVRQVFRWVVQERCTLGEVGRRLTAAGIPTRTGKAGWCRTTIHGMLRNPAYVGRAAFGKRPAAPLQPRLRAARGQPAHSRRGVGHGWAPEDEWISLPVPALVDEATYAAAQAQLEENRQRARRQHGSDRYLLQGLVVCARCGYAYLGRTVDARNVYYRCGGHDAAPQAGVRVCTNRAVRTDYLDAAVWHEVCQLLQDPQRLAQEYRQRLEPPAAEAEGPALQAQLQKLERGRARLIDGYAEGLIERDEFATRLAHLRARVQALETQAQQLRDIEQEEQALRLLVGRFDHFAQQVRQGLDRADWATRREIMRALVKRVEIDHDLVRVVFRLDPSAAPDAPGMDDQSLQHCTWHGRGTRRPERQRRGPLRLRPVGRAHAGERERAPAAALRRLLVRHGDRLVLAADPGLRPGAQALPAARPQRAGRAVQLRVCGGRPGGRE